MNASHRPWLCISGDAAAYTMKNSADATTDDMSMPRVSVMPTNTPSHTKAAMPAAGMAIAHAM